MSVQGGGTGTREIPIKQAQPQCVEHEQRGEHGSALKATSEVGTGGPATRVIEADVLPTSPGHGDACGALGGYRLTRLYKVKNPYRVPWVQQAF